MGRSRIENAHGEKKANIVGKDETSVFAIDIGETWRMPIGLIQCMISGDAGRLLPSKPQH